jgi:hypothetical protein
MEGMMKATLLCSATAIMLCVGAVPCSAISDAPSSVTLYDQNDDWAGNGVLSENFYYGDWYVYDSAAADDFSVPNGHKWRIHEVDVTGAYGQGGEGPAGSENVAFYSSIKGLPGKLVAECDTLKGSDNHGSFAIKIPTTCKVLLHGDHRYWVSVVANEEGGGYTLWYWGIRNTQNGDMAAWENTGGAFGFCPTWEPFDACYIDVGPDLMFTLKGKDIQR